MRDQLPDEYRKRKANKDAGSKELERLRDEVANGVPGYLSGQREFLIKMSEMLPALAERLNKYMLAPVTEEVDGKGHIKRFVELQNDLSPGQIELLKNMMTRMLPRLEARPVGPQGRDNPMAQGTKFSVTVNTVGPGLGGDLSPGGVQGGQAVPTTTVKIVGPTHGPEEEPIIIDADPTPQQETDNHE